MSNWKGYEEDKWSGKKSDKRWFPFSIDRHDVEVNRIGNLGKTNQKKITVKIKNEKALSPNWTRVYYISPNEDGIDMSTIDIDLTVRDFYLIKDKGKWLLDGNTSITVTDVEL